MNLQQKYTEHILSFLEKRPYISISTLERTTGIAVGAVSLAKSVGRLIPEKAIFPLLCELSKCGITDINGYTLEYDEEGHVLFGRKFVENQKTIEVLTMKDGSKVEREVTDEMTSPDYTDEFDGQYSMSTFEYYEKVDKVMYTDYFDLL